MAINNLLAQKRLHFLTDSPSNKLLVNQLRVFPTGQHDDGPDSLQLATVAINHLLQGKKNYKPIVYKA
jgi:phage terminase large subunit-like protein